METPGQRIARWREHLGKSVRAFADLSGIPYSTIKTLETDPTKGKPSFDVIAKLRKSFPELNIEWLFDEGNVEPMMRDGRTWGKAAAQTIAEPDPPAVEAEPADLSFGHDVEVTVLRRLLADRNEQLEKKDAKIAELNRELGKPSDSSDAADGFGPDVTPTIPPRLPKVRQARLPKGRTSLLLPRLRVQVIGFDFGKNIVR